MEEQGEFYYKFVTKISLDFVAAGMVDETSATVFLKLLTVSDKADSNCASYISIKH